jgi:hypothetical protein
MIMLWFLIISLIVIGGLIVLYTVEAWIDLDQWIADAPKREAEGYSEPVNIMTPPPQPVPEPVKKLTPSLENFPKTSEDAKAKIDRLLKKSA